MNIEDQQLLTIARRTKKNLEFIYEQKHQGEDVEEFTQLLNSMLGMLVALREEYFKGREVTWDKVEEQMLLVSDRVRRKGVSFSKVITRLRNAFAHGNYELLGYPEITGIRAWNIPHGKANLPENRNWKDDFTEDELKEIAYLFIGYLEKTRGHELRAEA